MKKEKLPFRDSVEGHSAYKIFFSVQNTVVVYKAENTKFVWAYK